VSPTSRVWGGATAEIQCREFNSDAHCCHMMGKAVKHPVPDRVKPLFVIFDIRALWRSVLSVRVSGCQKLQWRLNPVWHRELYSCSHMCSLRNRRRKRLLTENCRERIIHVFLPFILGFFVWRRACHISLKPVVAVTDDGMTVINADVFRTNHFSHVASKSRGVHG